MNLPEKFKVEHTLSGDTYIISHMQADNMCVVSWENDGSVLLGIDDIKRCINNGTWKIIAAPAPVPATLLAKLKQFTLDTGTSIFICDGKYEVYVDGNSPPAKASSDEELEKIVDAILTLNKAVSGGSDNA